MMPLQRYVIANRRAGKFDAHDKALSRNLMAQTLATFDPLIVSDVNPLDPLARRVTIVEADPDEMVSRIAAAPSDVIIEPEILHWRDIISPVEFLPESEAAQRRSMSDRSNPSRFPPPAAASRCRTPRSSSTRRGLEMSSG